MADRLPGASTTVTGRSSDDQPTVRHPRPSRWTRSTPTSTTEHNFVHQHLEQLVVVRLVVLALVFAGFATWLSDRAQVPPKGG